MHLENGASSDERNVVVSFILTENEMGNVVLNKLENIDGGVRKASKKRVLESMREKTTSSEIPSVRRCFWIWLISQR